MLGYVRCATGDLLVKHHALYRAMYCGLCHSIGKNVGRALLPFLSYDFVFLAMLRSLAEGEVLEIEKQFCFLHPFKQKKKRVSDNASLRFAARSALFLTYEKMRDDLLDRDAPFFRRLILHLWAPLLKAACQRTVSVQPEFAQLRSFLASAMEQGRELEKKGASLDEMCGNFSTLLSRIFSFGMNEPGEKVLGSIGDYLGRWIYTVDALDDLEHDEKKGAFNPLLLQYGSARAAKEHLEELDLVLSYYISQMKLALDLLDGDTALHSICENIICLGLTQTAANVMKPKTEKSK